MRRHSTAVALIALVLCSPFGLDLTLAQAVVATPIGIEKLADQHPAEYYRQAAARLAEGKQEEAVFLFYLGQLRYRAHLAARPDLPRDGDPALFASLSEVVGRPINVYAFGDIPALARTIDAVLAYDTAHPDAFTPPSQFPKAHPGVRDGLVRMKDKMLTDADSIRTQRTKNGLANRN